MPADPLRSSKQPPMSYQQQLAIAADRMFLVLALLLACSSLILAIARDQWLPLMAVTVPALLLASVQVLMAPGTRLSRVSMSLVLMAIVATMIQQSGGLVEMHFGVFVVLALLLYYRDWLPIMTAAVAITVHHLLFYWLQTRGLPVTAFMPGSGFGIVLLHAAYVVVETAFVCVMAVRMRQQVDTLGAPSAHLMELVTIAAAECEPLDSNRYGKGTLAHGIAVMSAQIHERRLHQTALHRENGQIRASLDASRTGMMIADDQHIIRYANDSVRKLLHHQQAELNKAFDDFNAEKLLGTSIHCFHKNPERIRSMLNQLQKPHRGAIQVGNAHFSQLVTPVFNDDGSRIGFVVEWHDRTDELKVEGEIARIVAAASRGDLSQRLETSASTGFIHTLTSNINQLLDTVATATGEVRQMLSALSRGDLRQRIHGDYTGDFLAMKQDANLTAEQLETIVGRIRQCTDSINLSAGEIASGNSDLSQRTEMQAANLEETAASMEELTSTVRQNAEHARQANALAIGAAEVASQGGEVVQQVVGTMEGIEQSSRRIAEIISVIDGIAFQTNILALNAAVEAARAGEQGRGFAVVASEVRTLAQRSAAAAKEIKTLIDDSAGKVADGSTLVRKAGQTMDEIVASVHRVTGIMAEISAASQEQSVGIDQVNQTIIQMDETTQQNAALVEEATAAARSMEQQAQELVDAVSVFQRNNMPPRPHAAKPATTDQPQAGIVSFDTMIEAHHAWKVRLKTFLQGNGEPMDPNTAGRDNVCALGQWLYGKGQRAADLPEFQHLKREHAHFHRLAGEIVRAHQRGESHKAANLLDGDFTQATQQTVAAIRALRLRVEAPAHA